MVWYGMVCEFGVSRKRVNIHWKRNEFSSARAYVCVCVCVERMCVQCINRLLMKIVEFHRTNKCTQSVFTLIHMHRTLLLSRIYQWCVGQQNSFDLFDSVRNQIVCENS